MGNYLSEVRKLRLICSCHSWVGGWLKFFLTWDWFEQIILSRTSAGSQKGQKVSMLEDSMKDVVGSCQLLWMDGGV